MAFIAVNEPDLGGNSLRYLTECIETGWISSEGPFVSRFESEFSAKIGRRHGIAVANGSAAIDVALEALGIGAGDEVILPTFTIISCIAPIVRAGARPVVVDCDPVTFNMKPEDVAARITSATKAIMVVHIYGMPVDMDPLLALAKKHDIKIIEDAAEMHGQTYKGRACGTFGDISTFSFYPNKLITTGEGGMVLTDDDALAERCRGLRNLCFVASRRFVHDELGWNFRMTNLQAALGLAQLERFDEFVERKRAIGTRYQDLLGGVPHLQLPIASDDTAKNIYWVFSLVIDDDFPLDAPQFMKRLAEKGVGTRPFFWPMHEQPILKGKYGLFNGERYPVAERIARRGFYVPSGLGLTSAQQSEVAKVVREVVDEQRV